MKIYDEENMPYDEDEEDFAGYTMVDDNSIFKVYAENAEEETIATPIPENESTVIICNPQVAGVPDGKELTVEFGDECRIYFGNKCIGTLKEAFVRKLKAERGGQNAKVYYKKEAPPMVRLVFGEGDPIPMPAPEEA